MRVLTRLAWGSAKFWLGAIALVAAALAVARDRPANATGAEVLMSLSNTSPTWAATAILAKSNGQTYGSTPCDVGFHNYAAYCLYIWAKGVANTTGASAFQVHLRYPDNMIAVSYVAASTTWLASTGRSAVCAAPDLYPGDVVVTCDTILAPPPYGATGSGILVKVAVSSKSTVGTATLDLSSGTYLLDTPLIPPNAQIPATVRSTNIFVAPCADMPIADGIVKANDILYVVRHFHSTDAAADLDRSGLVTASDILIVVREYNWVCSA